MSPTDRYEAERCQVITAIVFYVFSLIILFCTVPITQKKMDQEKGVMKLINLTSLYGYTQRYHLKEFIEVRRRGREKNNQRYTEMGRTKRNEYSQEI